MEICVLLKCIAFYVNDCIFNGVIIDSSFVKTSNGCLDKAY